MRRRIFMAASLGVLSGCHHGSLYTGTALAFGTTVSVTVFHADCQEAELGIAQALAAVCRVDRLMSIYNPDSQVFRLNRDGVLRDPDPHLLAVLAQARALSVLSKGAFDISVQPLWRVFREATGANGRPGRAEHLKASARIGWERVTASPERVVFQKAGMAITLNGLAQGYGADLAMAVLRTHGIDNALVDAGEFCAHGSKPGAQPWALGIADPREPGKLATTLQLDGRSVATSGDYESAFTSDFVHHHIFDPKTGESPQELASVTVLAPSGMLADGLSTTFMVAGERKSHAMAATLPGVDLMTINKRGIVWKSPGFPATA